MKSTLAPGIEHERKVTVTPDMGTSHLDTAANVLSTPSMIALMERTSLDSVKSHLDDGEETVGTMVHVWHRAPTAIGETVTIHSKLIDRDRRKLRFEVRATHGDTVIGDGTHERFVIDTARFGKG